MDAAGFAAPAGLAEAAGFAAPAGLAEADGSAPAGLAEAAGFGAPAGLAEPDGFVAGGFGATDLAEVSLLTAVGLARAGPADVVLVVPSPAGAAPGTGAG